MNNKTYIIGLGHRARQGKDMAALYIKNAYKNVRIVHWADALYKEVENKERQFPLIRTHTAQNGIIYSLFDFIDDNGKPEYMLFESNEVPLLHKIFTERNIKEYWGADEKDAPMLQFWGTNYRRGQHDDYWVDRLTDTIKYIQAESNQHYLNNFDPLFIVIPDTRFTNEVDRIKKLGGYYIAVERFNEDGTRFFATDRDANHPSEMNLSKYPADFIIRTTSGNLESLKEQILNIVDGLISKTAISRSTNVISGGMDV